jgi:hypothetical protein
LVVLNHIIERPEGTPLIKEFPHLVIDVKKFIKDNVPGDSSDIQVTYDAVSYGLGEYLKVAPEPFVQALTERIREGRTSRN